MLDFHSEIPAQVALSGVMGPLSREAPLQLIAALAAAADEGEAQLDSPALQSAIRLYVGRLREGGVSLPHLLTRIKGLITEVAPELDGTGSGDALLANLIRWATVSYDQRGRSTNSVIEPANQPMGPGTMQCFRTSVGKAYRVAAAN